MCLFPSLLQSGHVASNGIFHLLADYFGVLGSKPFILGEISGKLVTMLAPQNSGFPLDKSGLNSSHGSFVQEDYI